MKRSRQQTRPTLAEVRRASSFVMPPYRPAAVAIAAVVPAKLLREAKSRLSPVLAPEARGRLAALMLGMVVDVLAREPRIRETIVVTSDGRLADVARTRGAVVCADAGGGLNAAIAEGARLAGERGARRILVLPADIPLVREQDIARLAASAAQAIVPSRDCDGTNALLLDLPLRLAPAFGTDSFSRHLDAAAALELDLVPMEIERIAFDVDRPEDLARLASEPAFRWLVSALEPAPHVAAHAAEADL